MPSVPRKPRRHRVVGPTELGRLLGVDRKTIWRWSEDKMIPYTMNSAGYRRYDYVQVQRALRRGDRRL